MLFSYSLAIALGTLGSSWARPKKIPDRKLQLFWGECDEKKYTMGKGNEKGTDKTIGIGLPIPGEIRLGTFPRCLG